MYFIITALLLILIIISCYYTGSHRSRLLALGVAVNIVRILATKSKGRGGIGGCTQMPALDVNLGHGERRILGEVIVLKYVVRLLP